MLYTIYLYDYIFFNNIFFIYRDVYFLHNSFDKIDSKDASFIFEALILGALKEKVIILMDDNPTVSILIISFINTD